MLAKQMTNFIFNLNMGRLLDNQQINLQRFLAKVIFPVKGQILPIIP